MKTNKERITPKVEPYMIWLTEWTPNIILLKSIIIIQAKKIIIIIIKMRYFLYNRFVSLKYIKNDRYKNAVVILCPLGLPKPPSHIPLYRDCLSQKGLLFPYQTFIILWNCKQKIKNVMNIYDLIKVKKHKTIIK